MSSVAVPMIQAQPRAVLMEDQIWRDSVQQSIYSTVGLDAAVAPFQLLFFGYSQGTPVPGAGNAAGMPAKLWHTNMTAAGRLGRPKKFRCVGARWRMPLISFAVANTPANGDVSIGAAAIQPARLQDFLDVNYSGHFRLRVGEKNYIDRPLYDLPFNVGFYGLAALSEDNGTAATIGASALTLQQGVGQGCRLAQNPVLIEDEQPFSAEINFFLATPIFVAPRAIKVYLDGNVWRGVQ